MNSSLPTLTIPEDATDLSLITGYFIARPEESNIDLIDDDLDKILYIDINDSFFDTVQGNHEIVEMFMEDDIWGLAIDVSEDLHKPGKYLFNMIITNDVDPVIKEIVTCYECELEQHNRDEHKFNNLKATQHESHNK